MDPLGMFGVMGFVFSMLAIRKIKDLEKRVKALSDQI